MSLPTDQMEERTVSRETVFKGGIITLHHDVVDLPSGRQGDREVVEHPGSVGVVAVDEQGRLLLVRQWRHPLARPIWEICAGTLHSGEDPLECARRELAEETGYRSRAWKTLGAYSLVPGYSTEIMNIYHATDLEPGEADPDEDENLEVEFFDIAALHALIAGGEVDMKTIGALALAGVDVRG
jgi:ADP-ribose diphosphatase